MYFFDLFLGSWLKKTYKIQKPTKENKKSRIHFTIPTQYEYTYNEWNNLNGKEKRRCEISPQQTKSRSIFLYYANR